MATAILLADIRGPQGAPGPGFDDAILFKNVGSLPPLKENWIGLAMAGMYRLPNQAATDAITDRPEGSGPALVNIEPLGANGCRVTWKEYAGRLRVWERSVSITAANTTGWKRLDTITRSVLHQLSVPGNTALVDAAVSRHVRVPVRLPVGVSQWAVTFKNFNEQHNTHYGELTFVDVYIGRRAKDVSGEYTANFEGTPVNIGHPVATGVVGTSARRYVIDSTMFELVAGVEYILSYGYADPDSSANHLGIGGSYLGTNTAGVGSTAPVTNVWSSNTPLDVYLTLAAPVTTPTIAYLGSSSETGLQSAYPLRDSWCWRHAEARGALPVMMGQSGATLQGWASPSRYTWTKLSSGFDRVDQVMVCPGSNDVYNSRTLAQLQADLATLSGLVRTYLSNNIVLTTLFPRLTESAAVKAVRTGYNKYLATLPNGALSAIDRERAVSTDAGLMRPDLNSGDGIHLTATGQALLAAAVMANTPVPADKTVLHSPNGAAFVISVDNAGALQVVAA